MKCWWTRRKLTTRRWVTSFRIRRASVISSSLPDPSPSLVMRPRESRLVSRLRVRLKPRERIRYREDRPADSIDPITGDCRPMSRMRYVRRPRSMELILDEVAKWTTLWSLKMEWPMVSFGLLLRTNVRSDWMVNRWLGRLIDWLVGWLVGWQTDFLSIDRLIRLHLISWIFIPRQVPALSIYYSMKHKFSSWVACLDT